MQIQIAADGIFELVEVPTGRLDLYAHVDGYLDAWHPGLDLLPAQVIEDIRPVTPSGAVAADDSLMLGGDVAGYTDLSGQSLPDNEVTLADWDFTAALFGRTAASVGDSARADINGDGVIEVRDLLLVGANFLRRGPRPVYKVASQPESSPALLRTEYSSSVDGEAVLELWGEGISAAAAYQFDLSFSPGAWKILEVGSGARGALMVEKQDAGGHKVATVLMGEGPATNAPLMSWRLQTLQAEPSPPTLARVLILDRSHREIVAEVQTPAGLTQAQPLHFALHQNYPNPFNPETTIAFTVPTMGRGRAVVSEPHVQLEVYNSLGQLVAQLVDGVLAPGPQTVRWHGNDTSGSSVGSGVYFYRLHIVADDASSRTMVRQMLMLR